MNAIGHTSLEKDTITATQYRILCFHIKGLSTKEISKKLKITQHTVKNQLYCARRRNGSKNITQLVLKVFKLKIDLNPN